MKSDLDALIEERGLDAVLVLGHGAQNPSMYYLVGGGHITNGVVVKRTGRPAVVYCNAMERAEAGKSGLEVVPLTMNGVDVLLKDPRQILEHEGLVKGRIGLYGMLDAGDLISIVQRIRETLPELELVGEAKDDSLFLRAMETKDESEIVRIRHMGEITTRVVGKVATLLQDSRVGEGEVLLKDDGTPLTVADVKGRISLWLAELGAVEVEGTIFAIGKDAGVPHSMGTPTDELRLGRTIIFDIFPAEAGGGYFYDFTRTWSLGYSTPEAAKLFDEVHRAYELVIENIDLNVGFKEYQRMVSEEFRKNGHATPLETEGVLVSGYVHSLGHGVGLNVHERPWSRHTASDDNILRPGVVIAIEPGLYYPEKGMGARIEDTYWVRPDGALEKLADYPYDFVLPMKNWRRK
jgi:Xaa-Pro aminopeptidase